MGIALPKLTVISLTENAISRVKDIMAQAEPPALGLRVGVRNGGCAGMSYTFSIAREINKGDEVIEQDGARVVVDAKAVLFLLGTELDFKRDKLASTFVFHNPNETSACGCGESVAITPASVQLPG